MFTLEIFYSPEFETNRVLKTISKIDWFNQNNYNITLPNGITSTSSPEGIEECVRREYSPNTYEDYKEAIINILEDKRELFEKIKESSLHLENKYKVYLTKYGVGGSYSSTDHSVIINIQLKNKTDVLGTLLHEIIHISIEPLIKKYNVSHWKKERLVDLIFDTYFSEIRKPQKITEDISMVDVAFERYYPDLENLIQSLK